MSGCMLTFSPDLTLNFDLFYELACELVFYSVDGVKVNRTKKKPLIWSSQLHGRKSFQWHEVALSSSAKQYFNFLTLRERLTWCLNLADAEQLESRNK